MVAQVPGVTIDEEGNVSAHGEPVGRILVDGKEFFSTDPKIALKTLPADIIDKLQIIDEKSEQARFSGFDDGKRTKVINIVTKPDKRKGYFGKVNAGKGDGDKFGISSSLNSFNGDEKISINIMGNNINETNFAEQGRGGSRRGNNNTDRGLSDTYAAAANYTNTFLDKKLELNGNYNFRNTSTYTNTLSDIEYIMGSRANQFQHQQQIANQGNQEHNFRSRLKWDIDSINRLDFSPSITYNTSDRMNSSVSQMSKGEERDLLNTSDRNNNNENSNFNFGAGLTFMHRFKGKGQTITLSMDGNKSTNDALGKTLAFNEYYKDAELNRIDTNDRESITYGYGSGFNSRLAYAHSISRYSRIQMNYGFRTTSNYADRKTLEFLAETGQYEELNERLSNEFRNDFNHHSTGISYGYNKQDTLRIQVGLNYETGIRVNDRTVPIALRTTADFSSLLPEFSTTYFFTKERNLEFNYNTATNTPSIDQLQDYIDNANELYIRNGNPNLKQEYSHRLRFQYRDVN
ncbi:MAG: outer membrane beta-barrel protein, partial [Sphingobacterium sp.]